MCCYFFLSISKWYLNSKILRLRTYWLLLLIPTICERPKSSKIKQVMHIWGLTALFKKFDSEISIYITRNHWTTSSGNYIYVHSVVNFVMAIIPMLWVNDLYLRTCKHKLFIYLEYICRPEQPFMFWTNEIHPIASSRFLLSTKSDSTSC